MFIFLRNFLKAHASNDFYNFIRNIYHILKLSNYKKPRSYTVLKSNLLYYFSIRKDPLTKYEHVDKISGYKGPELLIAADRGLYHLTKDGSFFCIFDHCRFHGISYHCGKWYLCEITIKHGMGKILTLEFVNKTPKVKEITRLRKQYMHQCDFIGDALFVCDFSKTSNTNRKSTIVEIPNITKPPVKTKFREIQFPKEMRHVNSIFHHKSKFYVMLHNNTRLTGVKSAIASYDSKFNLLRVEQTDGEDCHNIYIDELIRVFLDSSNGSIVVNDHKIKLADGFARGLSVTQDDIFVGMSKYYQDRERRANSNPTLIKLSRSDYSMVGEYPLPKIGGITEIRCLSDKEYTLSNNEIIS